MTENVKQYAMHCANCGKGLGPNDEFAVIHNNVILDKEAWRRLVAQMQLGEHNSLKFDVGCIKCVEMAIKENGYIDE